MSKTKIIELIYTTERRGTGKDDDPVRLVEQLWTKDGNLVIEGGHFDEVIFNNNDLPIYE